MDMTHNPVYHYCVARVSARTGNRTYARMSIHTIIVLLVLYCAVRALLRKKPTDPMAGRLIPRSRELHATICAQAKLEHDTFAARHTKPFVVPAWGQDLVDNLKRNLLNGVETN
jgi:hypothetical protein